jgi:hypothetical protein
MSNNLVCTACGHIGEASSHTPGSTAIEVVLWLCFLVPGIVYSLWRLNARHDVCPVCGNPRLLPADAPIAQKFVRENLPDRLPMVAPEPKRYASRQAAALGRKLGRVAGRFFR